MTNTYPMTSPSPNPLDPPIFSIWPLPQAEAVISLLSNTAIIRLRGSITLTIGSFGSKLVFIDRPNWVSSVEQQISVRSTSAPPPIGSV
ncbi:hypothetical protein LZ30DRAFT_731481 [Colletotrichum cereale]|nr:hypothetical protein LZ30DRAFT_731481 [Colletotrichum cereale]